MSLSSVNSTKCGIDIKRWISMNFMFMEWMSRVNGIVLNRQY
jgi:hypothetical protein